MVVRRGVVRPAGNVIKTDDRQITRDRQAIIGGTAHDADRLLVTGGSNGGRQFVMLAHEQTRRQSFTRMIVEPRLENFRHRHCNFLRLDRPLATIQKSLAPPCRNRQP